MVTLYVIVSLVCLFSTGQSAEGYCSDQHNLIDAYPRCLDIGFCPYISAGSRFSVNPNPWVRLEYTTRAMARLYPEDYAVSKYGYTWGKSGNPLTYACTATAQSNPLYWLSGAEQAQNFHVWSKAHCSVSGSGHFTCPDYCHWFQGLVDDNKVCGYTSRVRIFQGWGPTIGSEGIWNTNGGFGSSGHCGPIFNPVYTHMGLGTWVGHLGSVTQAFLTWNNVQQSYPLVHGVHFDERTRIPSLYYDANGEYFTFLLEFWGDKENVVAQTAYLLYDGEAHVMERIMGTAQSGFYELHFAMPEIQKCKPYAFLVIDTNGDSWRLPQCEHFFFGTYIMPADENSFSECEENHYFFDGESWTANTAEQVSETNFGGECQGCDDVPALVTVYKNLLGPTPGPTPSPTASPSVGSYNFIYVAQSLTWLDAMDYCYDMYGSELASAYNDDEWADIVFEYANGKNMWIGLTDGDVEGTWLNVDGTDCNGISCEDLPYWFGEEPIDTQYGAQDAGYVRGDAATKYEMLADARTNFFDFNFLCNPARTKYPTAPTLPSAAPSIDQTCGDYQCVTFSNLDIDAYNGEWHANGGDCYSDRSYYTKDDVPGVYLCLIGSKWTFTTTLCTTEGRTAGCWRARANIAACGSGSWNIYTASGVEVLDESSSLATSMSQCPSYDGTASPLPAPSPSPSNVPTPKPTFYPTKRPTAPTAPTGAPTAITPAPTSMTSSPAMPTEEPTANPTEATCGDLQCITVSGYNIDAYNGEWHANGATCFYNKSYYTKDDVPGVYLCLIGSKWTFTTTLCTTEGRIARCWRTRANINYCRSSGNWDYYNADGTIVRSTISLATSWNQCSTV